MTSEAARLLMRDLKPEAQSNVVQLPGSEALPTSAFPVVAVADVIICECRVCRACGSTYTLTSSRVHRLLANCAGDPFKRVLRLRKPDEPPLDRRVVKVVEVASDHCTECWDDNTTVEEAYAIEPDRPPQPRVYAASEPQVIDTRKGAKPKKVTINQLTAEQAAEFL